MLLHRRSKRAGILVLNRGGGGVAFSGGVSGLRGGAGGRWLVSFPSLHLGHGPSSALGPSLPTPGRLPFFFVCLPFSGTAVKFRS